MTGKRGTPSDNLERGADVHQSALDEDVAAILGLTTLELERGVGGWGLLATPFSRSLLAAAVVPALVVAVAFSFRNQTPSARLGALTAVATLEMPRTAPRAEGLSASVTQERRPKVALSPAKARAPGARLKDVGKPSTLGHAGQPHPRNAENTDLLAGMPQTERADKTAPDFELAEATQRSLAADEVSRDLVREEQVRRQVVAARLEAVDALRALRQK